MIKNENVALMEAFMVSVYFSRREYLDTEGNVMATIYVAEFHCDRHKDYIEYESFDEMIKAFTIENIHDTLQDNLTSEEYNRYSYSLSVNNGFTINLEKVNF